MIDPRRPRAPALVTAGRGAAIVPQMALRWH
jgi:hypothetical protein